MKGGVVTVILMGVLSFVEMVPMGPALASGSLMQGFHGHMHGVFQSCGGKPLNISEEQSINMEQCVSKMFSTQVTETVTKQGQWRFPPMKSRACGFVCMVQAINLFDKVGQPVDGKSLASIMNQIFPMEAAQKVSSSFTSCATQYGKNLVMNEGDCGAYRDLLNCFIMETHTVCDENWALF